MEAKIIKIGNSKGIIIPAKFLKLIGLEDRVTIAIENDKMIITATKSKPREGWEEVLAKDIANHGQPKRLIPEFFEDEEPSNLEW